MRCIELRYTDAIRPDAQKRSYWTMVSVDTWHQSARKLHWPKCLGPHEMARPASKLENKSNEIDREAAGTSERCGEILLAIGPYLRISRWSGRMRRRGSSLMPRYRSIPSSNRFTSTLAA